MSNVLLGAGVPVRLGKRISLHYTGSLHSNREVFDRNNSKQHPLVFRQGTGEVKRGEKSVPLPVCMIQNITHHSSDKLLIYVFPLFLTGLEHGLEGMNAGGERVITIPSKLGYGSKGSGEDIPPDSDLVFEVKVLKVG